MAEGAPQKPPLGLDNTASEASGQPRGSGALAHGPDVIATEVRQRAVDLFRALSHDVRLHVLLALTHAKQGLSVSELLEELDVEQSALSHQLKVLKAARLVRGERRGRSIIYRVDDAHVSHLVQDALAHVLHADEGAS